MPRRETQIPHEPAPSLQEYLKRRRIEGAMIEVPLYGGGRIEAVPTDENKVLITEKLNGCIATIVWTESKDKRRSAQIAHFPSIMPDRHFEKISEMATDADKAASVKGALVYMSSKRPESESRIIAHLKQVFGPDISIVSRYYKERAGGESGIVAVELKPRQGKGILFHAGEKKIRA
jgi:hypothetical protein